MRQRARTSTVVLSATILVLSLSGGLARTYAAPRRAVAAAQTITGTIVGRIIEPGGAGISGVLVRIKSLTNGFEYASRTDADGYYQVALLPPDLYQITAQKDGYQTGAIERYQAEVNKTKTITPPPITLYPSNVAAPAVPAAGAAAARLQVNTSDATLRGSASQDDLEALPLPGFRSFDTLALLVPGVAPAPETPGTTGPGIGVGVGTPGQFSVHGQRARSNNFTIDGSDSNDQDVGVRRQGFTSPIPQPLETIAEFEITTLLADAEAGRNTGGQVNVVTRAGQNDFHGQAYLYFTDDALNARDFFDTGGTLEDTSTERSTDDPAENPFRRYQGGFVAGGPVVRDRLYVFGGIERQHADGFRDVHFATPTLDQRNAAFQRPGAGFVGTLGFDVLVPTFYPLPNNPAGPYGENTFTRLVATKGRGVVASVKVDYRFAPFGRASTLTARYNITDDTAIVPAVDGAINSTISADARTQNLAFALNSTVGERAANQIRASYGRTALGFDEVLGSPFVFSSPTLNFNGAGGTGPIGRLVISPYSSVGVDPFTFPQSRANNTYQFADTYALAVGRHGVKFGADVRRVQLNSVLERNYRSQVAFSSGLTSVNLRPPTPVSGLEFAAFGRPSDVFQSLALVSDASLGLRFTETNLFVHDAWRVGPRVALTLGLRYEYNTVPTDATGRLERELTATAADIPGAGDPAAGDFLDAFEAQRRVLAGREKIYDPDRNDFAPRVGIAWDVRGDGRLAVRAGYGLYYDTLLGAVVSQSRNVFPSFIPINLAAGTFFPDVSTQYLNPANLIFDGRRLLVPGTNTINIAPEDVPVVLGLFKFLDGFPLAFTLPEKGLRTPYVHQYSLTVEQALFERYVATVSYVGTAGHKLLRPRTPNGGPFTPLVFIVANGVNTASPIGDSARRPNGDLGAYTLFESSANSGYNALELSLERRYLDGLGLRLAYTYAHAIDEVSDVFDVAGAYALAQDELGRDGGLRAERADAAFDVRHRFTAAWHYELPLWRGDRVFGGFELSGIATLQTGQPYTVNTSFDVNFDGNLTDRLATTDGLEQRDDGPVRLVVAPGTPLAHFLPALDSITPNAGVVGRNTFRSLGVANLDLAVSKRFEFGDSQAATVRLEAFNVFNRSHFGIPVRVLEAPGFGSSTYTTIPARTLQLVVRYSF